MGEMISLVIHRVSHCYQTVVSYSQVWDAVDKEREVRYQQAPASNLRLWSVGSETLTVGDEWEGIIYSLGQIIAPFGPELENSF